ncbi:MAG: glycosyltransferase [Acidobacteria bacterium]|nr:glycosyltransferase [Acidobacteriota bacterium]
MKINAFGDQKPFREKVSGLPKAPHKVPGLPKAYFKKIHVLFWPGWWYPNRTDSLSGIFIKKHAEAVSRFCEVSVLYITPDPGLINKKYDLQYTVENNLPTLRFYYKPSSPRLPGVSKIIELIKYVIAAYRGLRFLKETNKTPDVIHVNVNPPAGLILLLFTYLKKIPYIFTEHWSGYLPANGNYKGFFRKWLTHLLVKKAGAVTTVSENLKNAMHGHGLEGTYYVVPNVVDTDLFQPSHKKDELRKKKRILHVSGLVPVKNIPGMLQVVKRLTDKRKDFELYIVGDSEYHKELEQLASELGILNRDVFFQGGKNTAEVAAYMKEADFLLLFSHYENSPCVIGEAMASGLPVIAPHVGGIPELVNERTGILVKPGDEEGLLVALERMLDNYNDYNREYLRAEAVRRFSYEAVGQKFYDIYQDQKF